MGKNVLNLLKRRPVAHESVLFPRSGLPLHAMVTAAGRERQQGSGYDWHGLRRGQAEYALLQYTFAGRGQVSFAGQEHFVLPGQAMLLYFPHNNRYRLVGDEPWDFFWICFNGAEVMRMWRQVVGRLGPVVHLSSERVQEAAGVCATVLDRGLHGAGHASALAYGIAAQLYDQAYPLSASQHTRPIEIQRAMDHVRDHLNEPMTVEQLAEVAGYSKWHLARVFMKSEGVSPGEYITRQRMKAAAAMLQHSHDPIKTIAFRCGYEDPNYFAKVFRRCFHVSPRVFRDHQMFRGSSS